MQNIQSVVIVGTGKLAEHLSKVIAEKDFTITQIYGRTQSKAETLAKSLSCNFTTKIQAIITGADLYIIAISDNTIAAVSQQMPNISGIVVHTAGIPSAAGNRCSMREVNGELRCARKLLLLQKKKNCQFGSVSAGRPKSGKDWDSHSCALLHATSFMWRKQ